MDRTERLLDLVALLLDAQQPISWAELREAFPDDYGTGSDEACERKFERDKAELLELGIPLTYVQGDDERRDGYLVDRDAYYLPEVGLTPEELAVLYAAGSAALTSEAFPGKSDLAHALRKIGFFAGEHLPAPKIRMELGPLQGGQQLAERVEQLWAAAAARKWVEISYASPRREGLTFRRVDPYGLALRRGVWSLVGHCHLRGGIRTFQLQRIRDMKVNTAKPRSADFEVPAGFKLDDYVAAYEWQHRLEAPVDVQVELSGVLAPMASRVFPDGKVELSSDKAQVTVRATFLDGLLRHALSLGAGCRVIGPAAAVERFHAMAKRVLERHHEPSAKA